MKLFLDEDSSGPLLARLLRNAGHDVQSVLELGTVGDPDPVQFLYAVRAGRTLLTRNHDDFEGLHDLVVASGGHHPGLLIERFDNDRTRDLTPRGIAVAIGKIEASGIDLVDAVHVLNQWR